MTEGLAHNICNPPHSIGYSPCARGEHLSATQTAYGYGYCVGDAEGDYGGGDDGVEGAVGFR